MNWKLIVILSFLGLAMGLATVFVIPSSVEPLFWLVVLGFTAYVIAARCPGKWFQHGLLVGIANSVWVTGSHILFVSHYLASHPQEAAMVTSMPLAGSPRAMMVLVGALIGVVSGVVIGFLALLARKLIRPRTASAAAAG